MRGRPVIAITGKSGGTCGLVIEPGSAQQLAETLIRLSTDTERIAAMGKNARAMLDAHFTRREAFGRWRGLLDHIE
jgi:glycosyltransferase involved in cell wall biosynthesis